MSSGSTALENRAETQSRIIDCHWPSKHVRTLDRTRRSARRVHLQYEDAMTEIAYEIRNPRRRRLLVTTKIELKAIAPAASIGLRKPSAATGIRMML